MNLRKLLQKAVNSPANLRFGELVTLVQGLGFRHQRTAGSHHIFVHPDVPVPVNVHNVGGKAKPYQVRQVLKLVEQYNLAPREER
jgi:predicted RNA binding protein YcfA (HicA-like mRNA interferase family)